MAVTDIEIVKSSFDAYQRADATGAAELLASVFVFTSPQDDHISKATYMERCFPTADRFAGSRILEMVATANGVVTLYEYELVSGGTYRNAELSRVEDDLRQGRYRAGTIRPAGVSVDRAVAIAAAVLERRGDGH